MRLLLACPFPPILAASPAPRSGLPLPGAVPPPAEAWAALRFPGTADGHLGLPQRHLTVPRVLGPRIGGQGSAIGRFILSQ